jgi:hypothetical protein
MAVRRRWRRLAGQSALLVTLEWTLEERYRVAYGAVPLARLANAAHPAGLEVTPAFRR